MPTDNVWESVKTTAVAVDAESGRLIYVTKVTTNQALASIFGGGIAEHHGPTWQVVDIQRLSQMIYISKGQST
jgi:hypothetical protein